MEFGVADTNIIRARGGVSAYTALDAEEFLEERGREMFQESSRRTDLIRFGKYGETWWEKPVSEPYETVSLFHLSKYRQVEGH